MGKPGERCPVCGRFGSQALGGYCKTCHPNANDDEKHAFADFCDNHDDGAFFPNEFGILKDKFGFEER